MRRLVEAVNAAFFKAYPGATDLFEKPSSEWKPLSPEDEAILVKRVNMLIDDLMCTRVNFSVTNQTMCKFDRIIRNTSIWPLIWERIKRVILTRR